MIRIQENDFEQGEEYRKLLRHGATGACVTFVGLVRGEAGSSLTLEHYPGMTERVLGELETQARRQWDLTEVCIIHRVGQLRVGEQIVLVGVSSEHRAEAFAACEFLIDALKTQAPFWKKEQCRNGSHWVEAKQTDKQRMLRWGVRNPENHSLDPS